MKTPGTPAKVKHDALQELYFYLDATEPLGNTHLAWYGQSRAKEMSHEAALLDTIEKFRLESRDWFQHRLARFDPDAEYTVARSNIRPLDEIRRAVK